MQELLSEYCVSNAFLRCPFFLCTKVRNMHMYDFQICKTLFLHASLRLKSFNGWNEWNKWIGLGLISCFFICFFLICAGVFSSHHVLSFMRHYMIRFWRQSSKPSSCNQEKACTNLSNSAPLWTHLVVQICKPEWNVSLYCFSSIFWNVFPYWKSMPIYIQC